MTIIDKLQQLEGESLNRGIPIIGRRKGAWLYKKVIEISPKRVLELGTGNGYSGVILGCGGAKLTTIEINRKLAEEAKRNFDQFRIDANVILGDAVWEVRKMANNKENADTFDLVFIDFEKNKYLAVLEDCIKLIKKNSYIIADNIEFPGCKNYKEMILRHPKLKTEIIPIRDGLGLSRKL